MNLAKYQILVGKFGGGGGVEGGGGLEDQYASTLTLPQTAAYLSTLPC